MKKIILALTILFASGAMAQKSVVIDSLADNKAKLYSKSMLWVAKTWKSSNNVIQLKDEAEGIIVVKGGLSAKPKTLGVPGEGITMVTVTIRVKDGKAKIEFTDHSFKYSGGSTINESDSGRTRDKWMDSINSEEDDLILSFRQALLKSDDF